jgi:hypothetical protein
LLRTSLVALPLALLVGCTGNLTGAGGGADGTTPPGLTPGGGGSGGTTSGTTPLDCSQAHVSFAPLKRLTHEQYDNAIRDLLGIETHPSLSISADEKLATFYSNSVSPVTRLSVEQYAAAAEEVARAVVDQKLETLVGCPAATQNDACADQFIQSFGQRAFRRPLAAEETARYKGLFTTYQVKGFGEGIRVVLQTMLQSPNFVYHLELTPAPSGAGVTPLSGYELASRLSFALWQTLPDADLLAAAAAGTLDTKEGVKAQAERLLQSDRARDALSSFHIQWLGLENLVDNTVKDAALFPQWTPAFKTALRDETISFVDFVVRRGDSRLQTLLSAPFTIAGPDVLALYGASAAPGADGTVALDPAQRAGLLTQGAFLAAHAHPNQTSPVHRGLAVRKNLLCTELPDPPANVDNTPPEPDPNATTRERFEQHRADPSCKGCHELLDPIGVGLENYDAIGRYRTMENGRPIDSVGELTSAGTSTGPFSGGVELAQRLATSPEVRDCVQKQWFRFSLGRNEAEEDACSMQALAKDFAASDYQVKTLLVSLVTSDAFRYRKVEP